MKLTPQNRKQWPATAITSVERVARRDMARCVRRTKARRDWALERLPKGRRVGKFPQPDDPRRIAAIERGLDLVLRSYLRVRDKPPRCPGWVTLLDDDFHEYTREGAFIRLAGLGVRRPHFYTPERELIFALMGENPARAALRHGIRLLGEEIYRLTKSEDAMLETLEKVAALDPSRANLREVVMDKAWSGIGGWYT